jgi:dihydropteroate synthase
MLWKTRHHAINLAEKAVIMGVINVTPDSFSDGGLWQDHESAVNHAMRLIQEGADILDVGGESSRPGATPVDEIEELRRVIPVIKELKDRTSVPISIDTAKPSVASAALKAGASIVNDIGGLRLPEMRAVVAEFNAGAVCMHMKGTPRTMQNSPSYTDVVAEILAFFEGTVELCRSEAIDIGQIAFDPGIGFGKSLEHNLEILRELPRFHSTGRPLVLGVSRKSFLSKLTGSEALNDRLWPTVALSAYARHHGASVLRVHDVKQNADAVRMTEAIRAFANKRDVTPSMKYRKARA